MAVGLQSLLRTVVDNKASGLHIRGNSNAYVRLNGQMKPIEDSFVSNDDAKKMAFACMGERERKIFEQYNTVDFSLDAKSYGRFRFNVFRQMGKYCMAIRHIPYKIPSFESLHLPGDILRKISDNRRGLILVTGMTGSGKSSTLAAMIDYINQTRASHILTIEDPVEYPLEGAAQVQVNEKCGFTFASALRAILRQDPDVIMVGEIRDQETAQIALRAAQTGHLVVSTLHTNSAKAGYTRLEDLGISRTALQESLLGIMAQRLVRCRPAQALPYSGRQAVVEILKPDGNYVDGTLRENAMRLVQAGLTDEPEIRRVLGNVG